MADKTIDLLPRIATDSAQVRWFIAANEQQVGPLDFSTAYSRLLADLKKGPLHVWADGMEKWQQVMYPMDFEEIVEKHTHLSVEFHLASQAGFIEENMKISKVKSHYARGGWSMRFWLTLTGAAFGLAWISAKAINLFVGV